MSGKLLDFNTILWPRVAALVVGDVMLDRYWWGQAHRISPEAPVPVVRLRDTTLAAGGAANVAANLAGLGAQVTLIGVIGADEAGRELQSVLHGRGVNTGHFLIAPSRPTTVKTRIVAHGHHIARLDWEETTPLDEAQAAAAVQRIQTLVPQTDVVILSDYAKGMLPPTLLAQVIEAARKLGKPVLVDPKGRDYRRYAGASLLTPNRVEAAQACGWGAEEPDIITRAGQQLLANIGVEAVLITQGEDGMTLFRPQYAPLHLTARARAVYDVTGAGDTVIATLALALGAGADLPQAAWLANLAAGLVVEQVGTTALTATQLSQALRETAHETEPLSQAAI